MAEVAVRIDLNFHTTVAENAFGHYRDHINAFNVLTDNEGGWFIIGIGRACTHSGYKRTLALDNVAIPAFLVIATLHKRHQFLVSTLNDGKGVKPHQFAAMVGISIAGT